LQSNSFCLSECRSWLINKPAGNQAIDDAGGNFTNAFDGSFRAFRFPNVRA
jgi:hypothetical protein